MTQYNTAQKKAAAAFLTGVVAGKIRESYATYTHTHMRHHNPYYAGDATSLEKGMEENHLQFPNKSIAIKHLLQEGDVVIAHSHVKLKPDEPGFAAVHILRFEGERIVEMWDVAQVIPAEMANENGMF